VRHMAERRVPELFVEQVLLEEVPPKRRAGIEAALGVEELEQRLQDIRRSDEQILSRYPPAEMAARIQARLDAPRSGPQTAGWRGLRALPRSARPLGRAARISVPLALAAAAVLAVAFIPRLLRTGSAPGSTMIEATRVKGAPQLLIYRESAGGGELLADRAVVREGDRLQIKYVPAGRAYGAIVSVDGRGAVTLHYPESAAGSTRLGNENGAALDWSYTLDDAPGFERFFFVTAPREFAASVVFDSAKRLAGAGARSGPLEVPEGFEQTSVLLTKGE
jgi:hypothetical protein